MNTAKAALLTVVVLAFAATAAAETLAKWRTPDGRLHLGDRPPPGSVLIEALEFPDRESRTDGEVAAHEESRAAAAHGREIIRRRIEARRAAREEEAERRAAAREAYEEYERAADTVVVLSHGRPFGMEDCFDPVFGFYRPKPVAPPPPVFRSRPMKLAPPPKPLGRPAGAGKALLLSLAR